MLTSAGANGYLIDQFWQDGVNTRADEYGGSIENRALFGLEVTEAVIKAVGDARKVGMRLSPWGRGQGMGMEQPVPQFLHITQRLKELGIGYLHFVESRIGGTNAADAIYQDFAGDENDVFIEAWGTDAPILLAGGFTPAKAEYTVNKAHADKQVCVAFGRYFISNPDLPFRIAMNLPLDPWDRSTFYSGEERGYTDYDNSKACSVS